MDGHGRRSALQDWHMSPGRPRVINSATTRESRHDDVQHRHVAFASEQSAQMSRRRLSTGFMNWAHALDHFVILIYPTVVIQLEVEYGQSYATLIALATASFVAFGLFSLPAGWLGDRWSRAQPDDDFLCRLRRFADRRRVCTVADGACRGVVRARHVCFDLSSGRHGDGDRERHATRAHAGAQRRLRQSRRSARRRRHGRSDGDILLARRVFRARRGLSLSPAWFIP